jgi:hypothetical protein
VCGCCLGKGRDPHLDVLQHGAKRKSIVHTHKFCSSSFWMLGRRRPETFRDLFFPPKFLRRCSVWKAKVDCFITIIWFVCDAEKERKRSLTGPFCKKRKKNFPK